MKKIIVLTVLVLAATIQRYRTEIRFCRQRIYKE